MKISVCIATFRRPERLRSLMDDLVGQQRPPFEIVVVDNDPRGSARAVVEARRASGAPCPIHYEIQPVQNISLTRNATVEIASGDWLAFVDDDERAPPTWLGRLDDAAQRYLADGVLGPVLPLVPDDAPPWIRRGAFYSWARMASGTVVPRNLLRFGNVILRGSVLRAQPGPFDPAYGLTGGEDGDLLGRLANSGARIVWCDEACVEEPVETSRLSLRWLALRSLRGGQDFARHTLADRYGKVTVVDRLRFAVRALAQGTAATGFALVSLPWGIHRSAYWLLRACANAGKLTVLFGWHYQEYASGRRPVDAQEGTTA